MRVNEIRAQMSQVQGIIDIIAPKPPRNNDIANDQEKDEETKAVIDE
jgi:hypothetical protein